MLDLAKIKAVRRIVAHDNCADGLVSAMLARDACPEAEIVFVQHHTELHRELPVEPGMLFADFAPHPERVADFIAAGTLILDHHKTQRSIVDAFGENGVFGDEATQPGVCGATLVYEHVWKTLRADAPYPLADFTAQFARLAGVHDTWQRRDTQWHEASVQHATLMLFPASFWLKCPLAEVASNWPQYRWIGEAQVEKHRDRVSKVAGNAYRFTTQKGTRVVLFEGVRLSSDTADRLDKEVDLVVGFGHIHEDGHTKLIVSTRSHTDFDCATMAKHYGGGGHSRAAGCNLPIDIDKDPNPYLRIRRMIEAYEAL